MAGIDLDGVIPVVAEYYMKGVTSYAARFDEVEKLSFSGRFTDRRFLAGLERPEWEAVADDLAARLTDAVIADAVRRLPPELYARNGGEIERSLRARRDALPAAARELYRILAHEVDVRGTGEGEDFVIDRKPSGAVEVTAYGRDAATGARASAPFFHRTFLPEETSELRLYTRGGADRIAVAGETDRTIPVRVVAPGRSAAIGDRSSHASAITVHEPLPDGGEGDRGALGRGNDLLPHLGVRVLRR